MLREEDRQLIRKIYKYPLDKVLQYLPKINRGIIKLLQQIKIIFLNKGKVIKNKIIYINKNS